MPVDFRVGDVIRLRKAHPCGGADWTVVRIGADIGLKCTTCNHRILLSRREAEHGMRSFVSRAETRDPFASETLADDAAAEGRGPSHTLDPDPQAGNGLEPRDAGSDGR
jgi:hypothetical protein